MRRALSHVVPSHLMDGNLHPFKTLQANGVPSADGDIAFDEEPCNSLPSASGVFPVHVSQG
jgi:tRNA 2-thiocytidine biosynthesis protein TtcA